MSYFTAELSRTFSRALRTPFPAVPNAEPASILPDTPPNPKNFETALAELEKRLRPGVRQSTATLASDPVAALLRRLTAQTGLRLDRLESPAQPGPAHPPGFHRTPHDEIYRRYLNLAYRSRPASPRSSEAFGTLFSDYRESRRLFD